MTDCERLATGVLGFERCGHRLASGYILTTSTKAGREPVYAYDCWISTDAQRIITKHRGLRITKDAFLDGTKGRGFNETVFVASKVQASLLSAIRRHVLLHCACNDS